MVRLFCVLWIMLVTSFAMGQSSVESFEDATKKAQVEHKNILLYFSGSDWCAPCVKFKKNIIEKEVFKEYAQSKLVVFNADFPRLKKNKLPKQQEVENEKLAEKYNKNGVFPLIILFDENQKVIKTWDKLPTESVEEFINLL